MNKKSIENILNKEGIKADVVELSNYVFRVTSNKPIPTDVKFEIDLLKPFGITIEYAVNSANTVPVPDYLKKWHNYVKKHLKTT